MARIKGLQQLTVQVKKRTYFDFRLRCEQEEVTMSNKIRNMIDDYLAWFDNQEEKYHSQESEKPNS